VLVFVALGAISVRVILVGVVAQEGVLRVMVFVPSGSAN